jgi:hypothetical protein
MPQRPKKSASKVRVNRVLGTKDAMRVAFNALKATGKLPGAAGIPGKVATIADTASKIYRAATARPQPLLSKTKVYKGKQIPKELVDKALEGVKPFKVPSPRISKNVVREVDRQVRKSQHNLSQSNKPVKMDETTNPMESRHTFRHRQDELWVEKIQEKLHSYRQKPYKIQKKNK